MKITGLCQKCHCVAPLESMEIQLCLGCMDGDLIKALGIPKSIFDKHIIMGRDALRGLIARGFLWEPCECGGTGKLVRATRCDGGAYCIGGRFIHPNLKQIFIDNRDMRNKKKLIMEKE